MKRARPKPTTKYQPRYWNIGSWMSQRIGWGEGRLRFVNVSQSKTSKWTNPLSFCNLIDATGRTIWRCVCIIRTKRSSSRHVLLVDFRYRFGDLPPYQTVYLTFIYLNIFISRLEARWIAVKAILNGAQGPTRVRYSGLLLVDFIVD